MKNTLFVSTIVWTVGLAAATINAENPESYLARPLPDVWSFEPEATQTLPTDDQWWKSFEDNTLDSLITLGIQNNFNVKEAAHRREMARKVMQQTRSAYYPSVGLSAGYTREGSAKAGDNKFSLGADANWEIDIFGKITAKVNESRAGLAVSEADYVAAMVSMAAEIASYYVNYRVLRNHIDVAREHIQYQDTVVRIARARYDAGLVSKLDVAQANTIYYSTEASLPSLEAEASRNLNALSVLLGVYPADLEPALSAPALMPDHNRLIPAGVPANLLRRRPDIVAAEATLARYAAQIGIAKKDFLPTLSLTGSVGWSGNRLDNTFSRNGFGYSIAPQLSWALFSGMSRKYALAEAKEQMLAGIDAYNLTVMNAYVEVENAMQSYIAAIRSYELYQRVMNQSHEAFQISMTQYKQGLTNFTNVANAQIDWLNYANALISAQGDALTALIDLYKSLGGNPLGN